MACLEKCELMCEAGRGRKLTDWYSKNREESGMVSMGVFPRLPGGFSWKLASSNLPFKEF